MSALIPELLFSISLSSGLVSLTIISFQDCPIPEYLFQAPELCQVKLFPLPKQIQRTLRKGSLLQWASDFMPCLFHILKFLCPHAIN